MANNRNPPSDTSSEPGAAELDPQDATTQQQQGIPTGATPESDESTTTNPWIRNKVS
jgi:hypothetical protein